MMLKYADAARAPARIVLCILLGFLCLTVGAITHSQSVLVSGIDLAHSTRLCT